jgi:signal peptidase I
MSESSPAAEETAVPPPRTHAARWRELREHLPGLPQALSSLLQTVVVALFVVSFVAQPLLIPSESMERTLLVGDFLLFNKQIYARQGPIGRWLLPYRNPARGDIAIFRHPYPPMLIKRVVAVPGDRLRIVDGHVFINGVALNEPYVAFEPALLEEGRDNFPSDDYPGPDVDPVWWQQMHELTHDGELTVPAGKYFVLGDNRNHSKDSRYWGFVPRDAFVGRPLFIYFSLDRPSSTDFEEIPPARAQAAANDRLGHEREVAAKIEGFARWRRIFHVVH